MRTCNSTAHARAARSNGTVFPWTHQDRSVEITWPPSTTREVKTIFSVTSIRLYLSIERLVPMEARKETMIQRNRSTSNVSRRAWCTVLIGATPVLFLAACGSNTSSSGSGGTTPTSSSGYGGGRYGSRGTTPTASSSGSLIKTVTATVNGTSKTILTTTRSLTLYHRTSDVPPSTVCSGGVLGHGPHSVCPAQAHRPVQRPCLASYPS